jgi:hypothetical protein
METPSSILLVIPVVRLLPVNERSKGQKSIGGKHKEISIKKKSEG